jgi:hypothetical protein
VHAADRGARGHLEFAGAMKESALVGDLFEGTEIKITSDGDDAANHSGGRDLYPNRSDGRGRGPGLSLPLER